jgi:uncharacterized protein
MNFASPVVEQFLATGQSLDCPVINTHAHFGPFGAIYFPMDAPEQVLHTMDRCGVRWLIASSHTALVDTERGNREFGEIIAQHPDRFKGYWAINPLYPERVAKEVAAFDQQEGFVGFKFLSDYYQYPVTGPEYAPALEYAEAHGLPILLHTWGGSAYDGPQVVEEAAERYPNVRLLMGHAGFGEWQRASEVARDHPHVYLELTAAYSVRGAIELMVEVAGSEKITFGDDHPWFDPHYGIGAVLFAHLSDDDRRKILHRNAQRIFGLEV